MPSRHPASYKCCQRAHEEKALRLFQSIELRKRNQRFRHRLIFSIFQPQPDLTHQAIRHSRKYATGFLYKLICSCYLVVVFRLTQRFRRHHQDQ